MVMCALKTGWNTNASLMKQKVATHVLHKRRKQHTYVVTSLHRTDPCLIPLYMLYLEDASVNPHHLRGFRQTQKAKFFR